MDHGRVVLESVLFSFPGLPFPDTQLVCTGPDKAFTGIKTSAPHTAGIQRPPQHSPASWFEAGGFRRDMTRIGYLVDRGGS